MKKKGRMITLILVIPMKELFNCLIALSPASLLLNPTKANLLKPPLSSNRSEHSVTESMLSKCSLNCCSFS